MHAALHLFSASALLSCLALSAAASGVETVPWTLHNVTLWTASSSTPGSSYIDFVFQDSNTGNKVSTDCYRTAVPGVKNSTINDPNDYYTCVDPGIAFKYNEGLIHIARTYKDVVLDPKNKFVTSFGHATADFKNTDSTCGVLGFVSSLKVPITATS